MARQTQTQQILPLQAAQARACPGRGAPPGTNIRRITPEADAEWEAKMAKLATEEAARLAQQRRVELASAAGKAAAKSSKHVSRRGKGLRASPYAQ